VHEKDKRRKLHSPLTMAGCQKRDPSKLTDSRKKKRKKHT